MTIYKITNKINGKGYVGQTKRHFDVRINEHKKSKNTSTILNIAILKYGIENFCFEKIDEAVSIEELNEKETFWIQKLNTLAPNGYNLNCGGGNREWSIAHRNYLSEKAKELFNKNPEKFTKAHEKFKVWYLSELKLGHHPKRGKKINTEGKARISNAKKGIKNPMFGKKCNENQLKSLKIGQEKRIKNLLPVMCIETGKVYKTVTDAAKDIGAARSSVSNVLIGLRKSCKGFTFKYIQRKDVL